MYLSLVICLIISLQSALYTLSSFTCHFYCLIWRKICVPKPVPCIGVYAWLFMDCMNSRPDYLSIPNLCLMHSHQLISSQLWLLYLHFPVNLTKYALVIKWFKEWISVNTDQALNSENNIRGQFAQYIPLIFAIFTRQIRFMAIWRQQTVSLTCL